MIGSTISHYRILEKLGEGGMGEVYLAEDTDLDRRVALKFLPPHVARNAAALARFEREAKATAALQHPNIVTIHEIGSHADRRFIVMEYIDGDLLSRRAEAKTLSVEQSIDIAIQVSEALGEAHGAGIIHRDLKPDNVIIDKRGRAHVLDFGLAVQDDATRLTDAGKTVGTLHYMSPEQARGEQVDERTDVFSLGAILYEMITGQKAFSGDNSAAILHKIANEEPQPLSRYNNQASAELERVVATALAKDRDIRYPTMSGVVAALRAIRGSSGNLAATTRTGWISPQSRSRPRWLWGAGAIVVIAAAAIGFQLMRGARREHVANAPPIAPIRTLAVLPLKNTSEGREEAYFADGMTDALISDLSRVSALRVIPAWTVAKYKDSSKSPPEIAAELGADAVIVGSVWQGGNRVRINVDLIPAQRPAAGLLPRNRRMRSLSPLSPRTRSF